MKAIHLVLALAAVAACGKQNDVANLREEAVTLAKYYDKKVDKLDERLNESFKRREKVHVDQSLVQNVILREQEARGEIVKLRGIIGPGPDGKSAVEKQADAAAKSGNVADLHKLVDDTQEEIDRSLTIITSDIETVEGWLSYYDHKLLALGTPNAGAQPTGEQPAAPAPSGTEPAAPEAQGSAAPQQGSASPAQPKAQAGSAAAQPKK
jgi:hypothetical protein